MNTTSEFKAVIEDHRSAYEPETEAPKFVVITVDNHNSSSLTPPNIEYHSISEYTNQYFLDKNIETLVVPPLLGRGATGGGFDLVYFLTTHATLILTFLKTIPFLVSIVRKIRKYRELKRNVEDQKLYRRNRSSVTMYLQVVTKSHVSHWYSSNNRDSLIVLLGMLPDLLKYLEVKYGYLSFNFYLTAGIEGMPASYSVNLTNTVPTHENIGTILRHMDKRYVSDQDTFVLTFIQKNSKVKLKSASDTTSFLLPI